MKRAHFHLAAVCTFVLLIAGCAATKITGTWQDPAFHGPLHKVLVLAVAKKETTRRVFETTFARDLQARGVEAVPGFTVLPNARASEAEINAAAGKLGVDTVLVTKLVDLQKEKQRVTDINTDRGFNDYPYGYDRRFPYYRHWYDDYANSYTTVRSYNIEVKTLDLDTSLYQYASGKMIWTTLTRTTTAESLQAQTGEIVELLVKQLAKDGLL